MYAIRSYYVSIPGRAQNSACQRVPIVGPLSACRVPNSEENVIKEPEVLYQFSENEIKISPLSLVFKTEKTVRPQTKIAKEKNVRQQLPKKVKSTDKTSKVLEKKDKTSNKLSFVNNLLDYSIKKKVDEKTRERIFTLIGKEVENSDELKEVIARIEKLENELKPANQESVEEKFELDLSTHKPLNLVNFIFVITSYSIHYTKLYDSLLKICPGLSKL